MSEQIDAMAARHGVDRESLRAKYKQERDKRVRSEHREQYVEVNGAFDSLVDDPFVEPGFTREPLTDEVTVAIIGGGFGGLLAAVRLRLLGVDGIRIIESGGDFGGTWYWNRYPGAQCDIESYCYFPLLDELGYMPKERYSYAPEIFEYVREIGRKYDLYEGACFQTNVTGLEWDENFARWIVSTDRGDAIQARFVINAVGGLNKPKLPGIPGIEGFKGHSFHTCRWDYEYTGGNHLGGLDKLRDKRVAVIGTGCTAIQCVPFLGESAEHLYVFQRTPASVDVRGNAPTDPNWAASLEPGWQEARRRNFDDVWNQRPVDEVLVKDGWTWLARISQDLMSEVDGSKLAPEDYVALAEVADFKQNNTVRARVDEIVADVETREKLKAWYRNYCKRPTFNDEYLPTFNRPNVTLVDTSESRGVERINSSGLVAGGKQYEVDCIIFATGFEVSTEYVRRAGFDPIGAGGLALSKNWAAGPKTLHGITTHGFPNFFLVATGMQGAFGVNITAMLDDTARHVAYMIKAGVDRGVRTMQPTRDAEAEWVALTTPQFDESSPELQFHESCTPSYYNNEGYVRDPVIPGVYPHGVNRFNELLASWRDSGDLPNMEIELEEN